MKLRLVRHGFRNSESPDLMLDSGQSILARRRGLGFIPWTIWRNLEIAVFDEPTPSKEIDGMPDRGICPNTDLKPAMVGIMRVSPFWIPERKDRGHSATAWTKNPAFDDVLQQELGGFRESCMKGLYKFLNLGDSDHGRSSSVKMRVASHLHCSRGTALPGTGACQIFSKCAKVHFAR